MITNSVLVYVYIVQECVFEIQLLCLPWIYSSKVT